MKKGFTLIELLVVVLIIGILSAVALPQYQKAVMKARAAEVLQNMGSLEKALDLYLLENPEGDDDALNSLVISLPFCSGADSDAWCTENFRYSTLICDSSSCWVSVSDRKGTGIPQV